MRGHRYAGYDFAHLGARVRHFGGGSPSAPPPPPPPPQVEDPSIQANRAKAALAARKRKGRLATLLAGEGGAAGFTPPDESLSKGRLGD